MLSSLLVNAKHTYTLTSNARSHAERERLPYLTLGWVGVSFLRTRARKRELHDRCKKYLPRILYTSCRASGDTHTHRESERTWKLR